MFDLQVLAYQTDLTRVITFMIGREFSGRTLPGDRRARRASSRPRITRTIADKLDEAHEDQHVSRERSSPITWTSSQATPDGDGSLLDHLTLIYGAGMSDGNAHSPANLPVLLAGGGAGRFKGGRHLQFGLNTPLANLHVTLLDAFGVRMDQVADSTGPLNELSL